MKESNLQTLFGTWVALNPPERTTVWELKLSKDTSIPFDAVKKHQIKGTADASVGRGLFHKISDAPIFQGNKMRFTKPKPFDALFIKNAEAYIVVCFYKLRQPKLCYFITPMRWEEARRGSDRKSLTEKHARLIAHKIVII